MPVRIPEAREKENTNNLKPELCTSPTSMIPQVFSESGRARKMEDKEENHKLILDDSPEMHRKLYILSGRIIDIPYINCQDTPPPNTHLQINSSARGWRDLRSNIHF